MRPLVRMVEIHCFGPDGNDTHEVWFGPALSDPIKSAARRRRTVDKKPFRDRTKLYIFDFDGTLFRSPGPRPDHRTVEDWFGGSLGEDSGVPKHPNPNWYIEDAVKAFKQAQKDPDAVVAVITGRWQYIKDPDTGDLVTDFETRILELLENAGLQPDILHTKNPDEYTVGRTPQFKRDKALETMSSMPNLKQVRVYDDSDLHRKYIADAALRSGLRHVKDCKPPFDQCEPSQELEDPSAIAERHHSDRKFQDFLDEFYEGGKKLVPNLNPETKDDYPEVQVITLLKGYPPYAQSLVRKYKLWVGQGAPRRSKRASLVAKVKLVSLRWLGDL